MIIGNYEKFCKDYHLCEGYEKSINSSEEYFLHHIQGENISAEELIEKDLYFNCEPENLRWVTKTEHMKIHNRCMRFESRKKMSEAKRGENNPNFGKSHKGIYGPNFGKKHSHETRRKISDSLTGKPSWNKGKSWKLVNGKRIYSVKNEV